MLEFFAILLCSPSSYVLYVFQLKQTWLHKSFFKYLDTYFDSQLSKTSANVLHKEQEGGKKTVCG